MRWHKEGGTRIWRLPGIVAGEEETIQASGVASDEALAAIAAGGFTGVWHFCELRDLMRSTVFPELNREGAAACVASLQVAVDRARRHGLGTWLYFNDPGGVAQDDPFWESHGEIQGQSKWNLHALCTSTPEVQTFFRQAVESVFEVLTGVEGVILITACENLTHCWSKQNLRAGDPPTSCPRCAAREPVELILELLETWVAVSRAHDFRVMAWNWEWAYYYGDPQREIVARLPDGVELLLDMELGGSKQVGGREVPVGEYALSYVGPSPRLVTSRAAAGDRPVHAKLQINTTHELCSVPHLPVLATVHGKLCALDEQGIAGYMGCWNVGVALTLNTYACELFRQDTKAYRDEERFLRAVAVGYFGEGVDVDRVVAAWRGFSAAFAEYPFSIPLLYTGPHNDGPARVLSLDFAGVATGRSWMPDAPGDDLSRCLSELTIGEVIGACRAMVSGWEQALVAYVAALAGRDDRELGVAQMLAIQLRSMLHAFAFQEARQRVMAAHGLQAPCQLPRDAELLAIMKAEMANVWRALPLVDADERLGFHECYQGYKYSGSLIREKLRLMEAQLTG